MNGEGGIKIEGQKEIERGGERSSEGGDGRRCKEDLAIQGMENQSLPERS